MLLAHRLVEDPEYRDYFLEDLRLGASIASSNSRTFVQLGGNNPAICSQAARIIEPYCDGIGMSPLVLKFLAAGVDMAHLRQISIAAAHRNQ